MNNNGLWALRSVWPAGTLELEITLSILKGQNQEGTLLDQFPTLEISKLGKFQKKIWNSVKSILKGFSFIITSTKP